MKSSFILGNPANTCDRFLSSGYKDQAAKMDQYPYREDGRDALDESIRFLDGLWKRMLAPGLERLDALVPG